MRGGFRTAVTYGGGLIALYLGVVYFQGTTSDIGAASAGASGLVRTFQGR